jgi:hypothetical protein
MRADATYTYTGNDLGPDAGYAFAPFTTSDSVTGSFTVNTPLGVSQGFTDITSLVTSFSFSDGYQTITQTSPLTTEAFAVATNSAGVIDAWEVVLFTSGGGMLSCNGDLTGSDGCSPGNGWGLGGAADETFGGGAVGLIEGDAGTWAATPEPSFAIFLGAGLLGLIGFRSRRKLA